MPLELLEADGETPLGNIPYGDIGPGQSYVGKNSEPYQVILSNPDESGVDAEVTIIPNPAVPEAQTYLRLATGAEAPSDPGDWKAFGDMPLSLGTIAAEGQVNIWVDVVVPAFANRRRRVPLKFRAYEVE